MRRSLKPPMLFLYGVNGKMPNIRRKVLRQFTGANGEMTDSRRKVLRQFTGVKPQSRDLTRNTAYATPPNRRATSRHR